MFELPAVSSQVGIVCSRFRRHFPYRVLEDNFEDRRQRAFIELWHCFPSASRRWLCKTSKLPRGTAERLERRLLSPYTFYVHRRGLVAFGVDVSAHPFSRNFSPSTFR